MAKRRVDTKFVLTLAAVLVVAGGGIGGYFAYDMIRQRNPVWLESRAKEAESKGDIESAITYYQRAINRMTSGRSELADKVAKMLYDTSSKAPERYGQAMSYWNRAVTDNRNYKPARKRLLEETYEQARAMRSLQVWADVQKQATEYLKLVPGDGPAQLYLAEAYLSQAQNPDENLLGEARKSLEAAAAAMPEDVRPVCLLAQLDLRRAAQFGQQGQTAKATDLRKQAFASMEKFCEAHPKDSTALLYYSQFFVPGDLTKARELAEKAKAVNPSDSKAYALLASLNYETDRAAAEAAYKDMLKLDPESFGTRLLLGDFYQRSGRFAEAAEQYKYILDHHGSGLGLQAALNLNNQTLALSQICLSYMGMAEQKGVNTPEGKASLESAAGYIEQIKGRRIKDPAINYYEGRLKFLRGQIPEAMALLNRANDLYRGAPNDPIWRQTKNLLAMANERIGQNGAALGFINEIAAQFPGHVEIELLRARLQIKMLQYAEARETCNRVLKADPDNKDAIRLRGSAAAGLYDSASEAMKPALKAEYESGVQQLPEANERIVKARAAIFSGDPKGAMEIIRPVLQSDDNNLQALAVAVVGESQLAASAKDNPQEAAVHKAEARRLLDMALSKSPQNTYFRLAKVQLENPSADPEALQRMTIEDIPDLYQRAINWYYFYLRKNEPDNQLKALQEAEAKADPAKPAATEIIDLIFAWAIANGKLELAADYAQRAELHNIDGVNGRIYKARLEMAKNHPDAALKILKEATALRSDFAAAWVATGDANAIKGQADQATEAYERAITLNPTNIAALRSLVRVNYFAGDAKHLKLAQDWLRRARQVAPRDPELTRFDDLIGDPKQVIARRLALLGKNQQASQEDWENRRWLAYAYIRDGAPEQAIDYLLPLAKQFPNDLSIAASLARLYVDTKQPNEALKLFEPFLASSDAQVKYPAMLQQGDILLVMGQYQDALKTFESAAGMAPEGSTDAQRRLAALYFDLDDMGRAESLYRQISAAEKDKDITVTRALIEALIRQNKFQEANDLLENRVLREHPDDLDGLVLRGMVQLRQKKFAEALSTFNSVIDKNSDHINALYYRAQAQFAAQGDLAQAVQDLLRVRTLNDKFINGRLLLARVYRANRQQEESIHEYQDIVNQQPQYIPARVEYASALLSLTAPALRLGPNSNDPFAYSLRRINPVKTLDALLAESVKRFPKEPVWLIFQGDLLSLQGKYQEALAVQRQAAEMADWNPAAALPYIKTLIQQKSYDPAVDELSKLLSTYPNLAELYLQRGVVRAGQKRIEESLIDFDKALDLAGKNQEDFLSIVRQMGDVVPGDAAMVHLSERLKTNPNNVGLRVGLAQVQMKKGRSREAIQTLEPLLADKNLPQHLLIVRLTALARYQAGDYRQALDLYNELLASQSDDLEALNNAALILAENLNQPADGLKLAEQAMKVLKGQRQDIAYLNNGNVLDTYGWIKYLNNDARGAADSLLLAVQSDPLPVTYLHLAKVMLKQNRRAEARGYLQSGRDLAVKNSDPVLADIDKALKEMGS